MDIQGDHALCCKRKQDNITRHNRVRNWICKLADMGLLNPQMEKLGLLGPTDSSKRRPGDVSYGRGLAIDVAVSCPLVREEDPCELYAERQKHSRYDPGFVGSRCDFAAMVFETSQRIRACLQIE